ncbi:MAG TPA: VTT domain-containing protein [Mariniphaga sp.]|nr:VTT domain-containing protein [Mariniphaga sp.]
MTKLIFKNIGRIKILNRYYKITKFYTFLKNISIKAGMFLGLIILLYLTLDIFILDAEAVLNTITSKISPIFIFSIFFTSEFLLGIVPPEFFLAWTSNTINPWFHVFLFSSISYVVGILAYYLGKNLLKIKVIKTYIEQKASRHIYNLRRWGGFFIFVGAMLPVPYSMVCLTSGLINYKITHYLAWSLFRYVRFFIYAVIVFGFI